MVLANDLVLSPVLRVPGKEIDLFEELVLMEFQLSHAALGMLKRPKLIPRSLMETPSFTLFRLGHSDGDSWELKWTRTTTGTLTPF